MIEGEKQNSSVVSVVKTRISSVTADHVIYRWTFMASCVLGITGIQVDLNLELTAIHFPLTQPQSLFFWLLRCQHQWFTQQQRWLILVVGVVRRGSVFQQALHILCQSGFDCQRQRCLSTHRCSLLHTHSLTCHGQTRNKQHTGRR